MKHSIREHIIDPIRGKIVKVSTVNAELGSGITDKNGNEIFEGDIVKFTAQAEFVTQTGTELCEYPETVTVEFVYGSFIAGDDLLDDFVSNNKGNVEVVGHVDD